MAADLGWYVKHGGVTTYDHDQEAIQKFIHEIDKSFDLVLILENFEEGLILLSDRLNISLHEMHHIQHKQKIGKEDYFQPVDSIESRNAVYAANTVDYALYKYFSARFDVLWSEACRDVAAAQLLDPSVELLQTRLERFIAKNTFLQDCCDYLFPDGTTDSVESFETDYNNKTGQLDKCQCSKALTATNDEYIDYFRDKYRVVRGLVETHLINRNASLPANPIHPLHVPSVVK